MREVGRSVKRVDDETEARLAALLTPLFGENRGPGKPPLEDSDHLLLGGDVGLGDQVQGALEGNSELAAEVSLENISAGERGFDEDRERFHRNGRVNSRARRSRVSSS